ncbi:EpsG family protein [Acinetobacter baumannii]|uniref:EpsG family protein n=2 Tax=Acinetobacter baumannii TaxID=470 RepID=UPI001D2A2D0C|nr:EpsG family protein [Acinetobacter baumannii]EHU1307238.1 EpsG family protein [Acinetobacter baumannii]EHU1907847.1 EpsG family protein [Acinetobacter baumannii]EHU2440907.1 EpsG family protein [Acinetobacter baumannii]MDK6033126.1 EpsG family protein [Acinetobacter baumannii]MDK6071208.1 EpsG family protein [Acinetobacter baumannii]
MFPYFVILFIVLIWVKLEKYALNRRSFWVPLLLLSGLGGVRSNLVGTDSIVYTDPFVSNIVFNFSDFNSDIEFGYQALSFFILSFTKNYAFLFLVTSFFVVFCYLYILKKISKNYFYSVFLYITLGVYTFFFNGLRQGLAMAIFAIATPALINRKPVKYILITLIASLFHISALLMIPFYFIVGFKIRIELKVIAIFIFSFLVSKFAIEFLSSSNDRYEHYTQVSENAGGYWTLLFYCLLGMFFYIFGAKIRNINTEYNILEQVFICGLALVTPLALLQTDPSGPQRLLYYFAWFVVLLLPMVLSKINSLFINILVVAFFLLYFYLTTSRFADLNPYIVNDFFRIF